MLLFPKFAQKGIPHAIMVSVFSLVAVHMGVAIGHHFVDDASPVNSVLYKIDRGLEHIEILYAQAWGGETLVHAHLSFAEERIAELESVLEQTSGTNIEYQQENIAVISGLANQSLESLQFAINSLASLTHTDAEILTAFTMAVTVESTNRDIAKRIDRARQELEYEPLFALLETTSEVLLSLLEQTELASLEYDIEDAVVQKVRNDIGTTIASLTILPPNEDTPPDTLPSFCAKQGEACEGAADCCTADGLSCMQTFSSDGKRSFSCRPSVVQVCEVFCRDVGDGVLWSSARKCQKGRYSDTMPVCEELVTHACAESEGERINCRQK